MERYQLVLIRPEGFIFVESFREVMDSLQAAFGELDIPCSTGINEIEEGVIPIVFGVHHLHPDTIGRLPGRTILYNMEQLLPGYPWYSEAYLALLRRFRVWDSHIGNVESLRRAGIEHAVHMPVGYMPILSRIAPREEDVDVLFYGVMTPHRSEILEGIARQGINVTVLNGVFGAERDDWIGRAKLVLNLHQNPGGLLETPRIAYLLANHKLVVSESGDYCAEDGGESGLAMAPPAEIPALCRALLDDPEERKILAARGLAEIISPARRTTALLRSALQQDAWPPLQVFSNHSRHKQNTRIGLPVGGGINLVGHLRGNLGLSMVARGMARALMRRGIALALINVDTGHGGSVAIPDLEPCFTDTPETLPHPINLYVMPAGFGWLFKEAPWLADPDRLHVGCVWWELTELPVTWVDNLTKLDALIAGSQFIADVCFRNVPFTPVLQTCQPITIHSAVPMRSRFGFEGVDTVFGTSFDPNSDPARKNPIAAVRAFRSAFPGGSENVRLAIHVAHADAPGYAGATIDSLRSVAEGEPRIRLFCDQMSHDEVLAFYASCDVFVSLHRAEGLGLGMMEAMSLGKPVIATAWSGNMSYMNHQNSCPVRYRLAPVDANHPSYQPELVGPQAQWAEPLLEDAIAWMQALHQFPGKRREIGWIARADIEDYQREAWEVRWVDEIMSIWLNKNVLPKVSGKYSS